jgi:HEAT repeat protein
MKKQTLAKALVALLGVLLIGWLLYRAPWVREMIVAAAAELGAPAVPYLRKLALRDENRHVQHRAREALQKMGAAAVPALIEPLADDDAEVRIEAAYALIHLAGDAQAALDPLIAALQHDTDPTVRRYAAMALGRLGPAGQPAIPALAEALKDGHAPVRAEAADALGRLGTRVETETVVNLLIGALSDPEPEVRKEAAEALEGIGPRAKAAVPALTTLEQKDPSPQVRQEAKEALEAIQK